MEPLCDSKEQMTLRFAKSGIVFATMLLGSALLLNPAAATQSPAASIAAVNSQNGVVTAKFRATSATAALDSNHQPRDAAKKNLATINQAKGKNQITYEVRK